MSDDENPIVEEDIPVLEDHPEEEEQPEPEPEKQPEPEKKTIGSAPVVSKPATTTTVVSKSATTTTTKVSSAPSSPSVGGVDSSKLDVQKAKATMQLMGKRPNPGTMVKGLDKDYVPGGATVHTKQNLPSVTPGQHPWIAMGRQGAVTSTATTKKKIVLPPEGAWGDGHPGGVRKKLF